MLVSEAIDIIVGAELKQLAVKDDKPAIINYINLGILELYKRFDIYTEEAIITLVNGTTSYTLNGLDDNVSMGNDHEFMTITSCVDQDGEPVTINDTNDLFGVETVNYNKLKFKSSNISTTVIAEYRAAPSFVLHEKANIPLPPQMFEALFHYVGYRGHGAVKGDIKSENNTHYMRFNQSCKRISIEGLVNKEELSSNSFTLRGFC